jgi:hypothetical protein
VNDWDDIPVPGPLPYDSPRTDPIPVPSPPTVPSPRDTSTAVPVAPPDELAETGDAGPLDGLGAAALLLAVGVAAVASRVRRLRS